ncbi:myotubularin-related protein 9 [Anoplophora glabripennis]|uniref:myotubularin-related protein 9 n=1 Tax=Anoplophora glabripennis TaxID=217634 RepID=UPI000C76FC58|nr:myotubularin-related protein 9 [Anoplophora glabripennis]
MEFDALILTPKLNDVVLSSSFHESVAGTLCITGHHLILQSHKNFQELWLLHQSIDSVEKIQNSNQNGGTIVIKCKDFRIFNLELPDSVEFLNLYISIKRLANLNNIKLLYPFFYRPMYNILENGYALFKPESEFTKLIASDEWRISIINKNYSTCNTYSATLIVPKIIDDEVIIASANFRQGGRFPVFSYKHKNGTILLRSSQPLLNNCNRRCAADEKILNAILGPFQKGYIIDTRSSTYINSCKGKGGGTEPEGYYTNWKKVYKPLDKISKCDGSLLDNLSKLIEDANNNGDDLQINVDYGEAVVRQRGQLRRDAIARIIHG